MQLQTTTVLVLLILGGAAASASDLPAWVAVLATALVACLCSAAADLLQWTPSGCLFFVFAFAVSAYTPAGNTGLQLIAATAAGSAVLTVLVTIVGGAFEAATRRRSSNDALGQAPAAPPRLPVPLIAAHALACLLAAVTAGLLSFAGGMAHPYWAMVTAIVPVIGATTVGQLTRATHRMIGTFLGIGVTGLFLFWAPAGLVLIVVLALLTALTELTVARNYGLAMLFLTPLTIGMMFLNHPQPLGPLLADRALETCVGLAVVMVLIVLTHNLRHPEEERG